MEIKKYYDPIDQDGSALNRYDLLESPVASGIVAEIKHQRKIDGQADQSVSAAQILAEMQSRGMIKELRCRDKVSITRLTENGLQNFSRGMIKIGLDDGWLTLADDAVVIHGLNGDVTFYILRKPGRYCCHDGALIDEPIAADGRISREYVAEHFPGIESPDPNWPHGYEVLSCYECKRAEV